MREEKQELLQTGTGMGVGGKRVNGKVGRGNKGVISELNSEGEEEALRGEMLEREIERKTTKKDGGNSSDTKRNGRKSRFKQRN